MLKQVKRKICLCTNPPLSVARVNRKSDLVRCPSVTTVAGLDVRQPWCPAVARHGPVPFVLAHACRRIEQVLVRGVAPMVLLRNALLHRHRVVALGPRHDRVALALVLARVHEQRVASVQRSQVVEIAVEFF